MNNYTVKTITAPTDEPIDSTEAKLHMAIDDSTFDTLINDYIKAARMYIEAETGRQICTATYDLIADSFGGSNTQIYLPFGQLQSITSITYTDTDGASQTLASSKYQVSDSREPAVVQPSYSNNWPTTRDELDAVKIRFVCGYGDSNETPEEIKQIALMLVAHWFEHREAVVFNASAMTIPVGLKEILQHYKIGDSFTWYEPAR